MPSVHIYCRVSSEKQEDGYSLETQEAACRAWAEHRGLPVASVTREVMSGTIRQRPEMDAIISRLLPGDVFLCHTHDRFTRDMDDDWHFVDRVRAAGATCELVLETFDDTPTGKLHRTISAWKSQSEAESIRERTQRGRRARVAAGKPIVGPRPAYGYVWNADKTRYVADPETAPVVRQIFDWALDGVTLRGIAARLYERGIASPTGQPRWTPPVIRNLLLRPVYAGTYVAYRKRAERQGNGTYKQRPGTEQETVAIPGIADAIVTDAEQAAIVARLAVNAANSTRNNRDPEATLLRAGIARCGHCGWAMCVAHPPANRPNSAPQYRCTDRAKFIHGCPLPTIAAPDVDAAVWANVCTVLRAPAIIAAEMEKHRTTGGLDRDLAALDKRLEGVATKQTTLARRLAVLSDEAAEPLMAELELLAAAKRTMAADRAALVQRMADAESDRERVRTLTEWCQHFAAHLDSATYEQKRTALEALGVQVYITKPGTLDADGNPRPRWEMTMRPLALGAPVVYASSRR